MVGASQKHKELIEAASTQLAIALGLSATYDATIAGEAMLRTIQPHGLGQQIMCHGQDSTRTLAQIEAVLMAELLGFPVREDLSVVMAKLAMVNGLPLNKAPQNTEAAHRERRIRVLRFLLAATYMDMGLIWATRTHT